jgi:hypothetical protein
MRKLGWILGGALVAAGLVGGQWLARTAGAQDGLPDISGDWDGVLKGKDLYFEDGTKPQSFKNPCSFAAAQSGASLTADLTPQGDGPIALQGAVGNGHFWALGGTADEPILVTGHVSKSGTGFKGTLLFGDGESIADARITGVAAGE